jgi:hypothetical protein
MRSGTGYPAVVGPSRDPLGRRVVSAETGFVKGAVNGLTDAEEPELTRAGLLGMLAGKTKEAIGELVGNEHLLRDGREQIAEIDAEAERAAGSGPASQAGESRSGVTTTDS